MWSAVRVGTHAPITSKITPRRFSCPSVGSCKTCTCACLRRFETEHRAEQESGGREKSIRMNYRGRETSLRGATNTAGRSSMTFPRGSLWTRIDRESWKKEKSLNVCMSLDRNCQMLPTMERS